MTPTYSFFFPAAMPQEIEEIPAELREIEEILGAVGAPKIEEI